MHEKAFRSDLSTPVRKPPLWRITYYELLFPIIYLYLVAFLHFLYDGVGINDS